MTNAEKIRSVTDEELAKLICDLIGCVHCPYRDEPECYGERIGWLDWLKQEVSDGSQKD